ncbi:uncharacterized protein DSM5745_04799 [Aspergillus mulundensis]|uniref:Uncharacterized protein n=1 Tax=Aspergillus mulundensis TaxID=1810919 RepID=A0A3D8S4M3_9EURO|nr:Uncharacterized protein DSM5745_04799 [Aspergillus mulundensis]RDW81242.1 Uncharacterized protein DSM5745_04799 [Aspergillus mulundensis]
MSSSKSHFVDDDNVVQDAEPLTEKQRKRRANLYDAIAGRVNSHGFISAKSYASKYRDTASSSSRPIPPEEVLFRRKGMPVRYEETDTYFAHESLSSDRPLPSSELLEAIHSYTADFYDQAVRPNGRANHYSMNGRSLMFMGILLEELARESLGETGDLALVEGDTMPTDDEATSRPRKKGRKRATSLSSMYASSGEDLDTVVKRKKRNKRPRLTRRTSTTDIDTEAEDRR